MTEIPVLIANSTIATCIRIAVVLFTVVCVTLYFGNRNRRSKGDKPQPALAVLLARWCYLEEGVLRAALSKGFGVDFSTNSDQAFVISVIEGAQYMLKKDDTMFLIHCVPTPYYADVAAVSKSIKNDDELAEAVRTHQGWLSIGVVKSDRKHADHYANMAPVLAELAPEQAVALVVDDRRMLLKFDEETRQLLKSPERHETLGF